ncbi:MAG: TonB-dependent receptor [Chlorobi bacterium]|nr:TonB-dependent receptor [Chlorobiota bacterium]
MKKIKESLCSFVNEHKKTIIVMRNTVLLLLIGVFQMHAASSYSQTARLNLKFKAATVKEVLSEIENQSDFYFLYNSELIDVNRKVDISVKNKKISDVLTRLFDDKVRVLVNDKYIILTPIEGGQQNVITGKVTDENGDPLPGVSVVVKGTTHGVITNADGVFSISDVPAGTHLIFSFIGMKTEEVVIGEQTNIDVAMQSDIYNLDEVITVGYSTVKKRDVTGSISSIGAKDLAKTGSATIAQAIQGKTAGVLITRKSGKPGADLSVRIRGVGGINNSEPLYIVDGIYGGSLQGINPDEIESIEILKDASSAAIYGARGANGVVLITTKRGKSGNMKVTYNGSIGFQNMINSGDVTMLNAQQYAEVQNTMYRNDGLPEPFGGDPSLPADLFPPPSQLGEGTDWLDVMFKKNAPIQDHLLSFSGGSEKHTAYVSISYLDQDGLGIESGMTKVGFRVNTDHKVKKWLKVGNSTSFSNTEITGQDWTDHKWGQFYETILTPPTIPVFNEDGTLAGPENPFYGPSRTPYAKVVSSDPDYKSFGISNSIYADIKFWEFLTFHTNFNNNYSASENTGYTNDIYNEGIVSGDDVKVKGTNSVSSGWTWSNVLKFNKHIGSHSINALAGYERRYSSWNSISGNSRYLDPSYKVVGSGAAETSSFIQYRGEESMVSYFASASYNYKEKYYFTGNVRHDGSSRFGENNRFGTFPSFSVAWRLSNEGFFPENDIVTDIKLRGSWGQVGNDKIGNYRYIAPMANVFYTFSGQNGDFSSGLVTKGLANTDLKWETSTQTNFGVDLLMFNSKLRITADYFKTDVTDMLLGKTIPVTSGIADLTWGRYVSVITNAGALTNKGFEFEASYNNTIGNFTYNLHANITTYNNEVTDIGENEYLSGTAAEVRNRTYVGGSLGDFYGYVCEGIFQTQAEVDAANALNPDAPYQTAETVPGDFKFKDLNGDGLITDEDRQIIGSPIPDFTYGFGFDLAYKRLSLTTLFYGSYGNEIYNELRSEIEQQGRSTNKATTVLDAWHGEGTSNTIPVRRVQDYNNNFRTSTAYLEDGSFLRLQNIVLSYNLPVSIAKIQVYVSGDNLVTFTKYKGFNPEIQIDQTGDYGEGSRLDSGVDGGYYPSASIYRIGVNVTF